MVWAVILSLLLFVSPAYAVDADLVDSKGGETEVVYQESSEDSASDFEPATTDDVEDTKGDVLEPVQVVEVATEPVTYYNNDGEVVMSSEVPVAVTLDANSATSAVYGSVTGGTYTTLAAQTLAKMGWNDDYVFYRAGQYAYVLAVGDLEFSNGSFTSDSADIYTWRNDSMSGYTFEKSSDQLNLTVGSYIVYSNLGPYPVLDLTWTGLMLVVYSIGVVCLCMLIRPIFDFTLRMGRNVHTIDGK